MLKCMFYIIRGIDNIDYFTSKKLNYKQYNIDLLNLGCIICSYLHIADMWSHSSMCTLKRILCTGQYNCSEHSSIQHMFCMFLHKDGIHLCIWYTNL